MDIIKRNKFLDKIRQKEWKNRDKRYVFELQKLLDIIDNIEDEDLRLSIIYQIINLDNTITEICEEMIEEIYLKEKRHK